MNDTDYLAKRVDDQIDWYDRKSVSCQRWFKRLRGIELISAALIPFISGLSNIPNYQLELTLLAGLLGVLVTVAAGLLSLNQYQERWVEYRSTAEALKREKYLYLARSDPYADTDPYPMLVRTVEGLLAKETTRWGQYMHSAAAKAAEKTEDQSSAVASEIPGASDAELAQQVEPSLANANGSQGESAIELATQVAQQIATKGVTESVIEAVTEPTVESPLKLAIQKALSSFGLVLGTGAPPLGLVFALSTIATKLGREGFAKWKLRLLHLPYTPSADRLAVVDANTGFALFQQASIFSEAFQSALGDRRFLKSAALDFIADSSPDKLWEKYQRTGQFSDRQEFDEGLREFRHVALAAELEEAVDADWAAEAGGFKRLLSDVDALHVDPHARADLANLLGIIETTQGAGDAIDSQLKDIRGAYSS